MWKVTLTLIVTSALLTVACSGSVTHDSESSAGGTPGSGGTPAGTGSSPSTGGGPSTQPSDCGSFTPCGGDPTGSWTLVQVCGDGAFAAAFTSAFDDPACTDIVTGIDVTPDATLTLLPNGTGSFDGTMSTEMTLGLTHACVEGLSDTALTTEEFALFCTILPSAVSDPTIDDFTCSMAGELCACTVSMTTDGGNAGTYTIEGSAIRFSTDAPEPFCVAGDRLVIQTTIGTDTALEVYERM